MAFGEEPHCSVCLAVMKDRSAISHCFFSVEGWECAVTRCNADGEPCSVRHDVPAAVVSRYAFDTREKIQDNTRFRSEGFPSGQRGQTVNLLAQPSKVRILPPPPLLQTAGRWILDAKAGVAQW